MRACCAALQPNLGLLDPASTTALNLSAERLGECWHSAEAIENADLGARPTEDSRNVARRGSPGQGALADVLRQPSQALLEGASRRPPACPFAAGQLERPALHLGQRRVVARPEALEQHHPQSHVRGPTALFAPLPVLAFASTRTIAADAMVGS